MISWTWAERTPELVRLADLIYWDRGSSVMDWLTCTSDSQTPGPPISVRSGFVQQSVWHGVYCPVSTAPAVVSGVSVGSAMMPLSMHRTMNNRWNFISSEVVQDVLRKNVSAQKRLQTPAEANP